MRQNFLLKQHLSQRLKNHETIWWTKYKCEKSFLKKDFASMSFIYLMQFLTSYTTMFKYQAMHHYTAYLAKLLKQTEIIDVKNITYTFHQSLPKLLTSHDHTLGKFNTQIVAKREYHQILRGKHVLIFTYFSWWLRDYLVAYAYFFSWFRSMATFE